MTTAITNAHIVPLALSIARDYLAWAQGLRPKFWRELSEFCDEVRVTGNAFEKMKLAMALERVAMDYPEFLAGYL